MAVSIPWQCWEAPGFKACHAKEWEVTRSLCLQAAGTSAYGGDIDRCISEGAIIRALENCGSLCKQANPTAEEMSLPADPSAIQLPETGLSLPNSAKIMGVVAVAGIVVFLIMRKRK